MGVFPSHLHKSAVPCVHLTLASSKCFSSLLRSSALDGSCHNSSKNGFWEKGKEKASSIESGMRRAGDGACRRYRFQFCRSLPSLPPSTVHQTCPLACTP